MRKPDGHGVINPAFVQISQDNINDTEGYVNVQLTEQCLAVAGRGYADLVEYDAHGSVLSSIPFILNIMSSPNLGDNITSNDEFQQLSQLMADTQALLQNAPSIDPVTKHWYQYSEELETKIDTGIVAEGYAPRVNSSGIWETFDGTAWSTTDVKAIGLDGASVYFVEFLTGEPDSEVQQKLVSIVPSGTSYYIDPECTIQQSVTTKIIRVYIDDNEYSIKLNDTIYYVQESDVIPSTEQIAYYSITIPEGIQGIQGPRGERGAAGAGGVTWVDDIEASTQRRIDDDIQGFVLLGSLTGCAWDSTEYKCSWTSAFDGDFSYETLSQYINIAVSDTSAFSTELDKYYVNSWDRGVELANPSYFTLFEDEAAQFELPSEEPIYLFGEKGIESGNVKLWAVSYQTQESFTTRDDFGYTVTSTITDDMRATARTNINAMKAVAGNNNGDVLTYDADSSQWVSAQPVSPQSILSRLTYEDLNQVVQNYSYDLVQGGGE